MEAFKRSLKKENIGCLLRMHGKWRTRWDLLMTFLAVWNSFAIPYEIAFEPAWFASNGAIALGLAIDALFVVDIILNFRTTYINQTSG